MKATNVRIIDPAKPPSHPVKPNLPLNAGAGLIFGLLAGVSTILIRSRANGAVLEPGDAALLLGIPELGVIPASTGQGLKTGTVLSLFPEAKPETRNTRLLLSGTSTDSPVIADSFRAVLASILFAGAKNRHRVLVVTSASPGEGKTTTTANLAVALANVKRKVLLIDGDIRSPRLHEVFGLTNESGLTTSLKQIATASVTSEISIQETQTPNLHVLTSGPGIHSGADLLFTSAMPSLIARLREQYDMILIDTPPMLIMPDARILGRVADAVVLIARSGQTARTALQAAYRRFVEDQTTVLGIVLNDWDAKTSAYNYYADYQRTALETSVVKAASPANA